MDWLPPEILGESAEDLFRHLAGRARLTTNKSDRDRTGWDFVVEFQPEAFDETMPLDRRSPRACVVQVKATASGSESRVPAKLSAVERLAKDPRPAFVVVFRLHSDGRPIAGYLIHLLDKRLAHVLRRLRSAEAGGDHAINHHKISWDYQKVGTEFELTPEGLYGALEAVVKEDPALYTQEKLRQIAELGYEDGQYLSEAVIRIDGYEHLTNIMFGLAPLRPLQMKVWDNRFGIRVETDNPTMTALREFYLALPHAGTCVVVARGGTFDPAVRFEADVFVPPPIPGETTVLIRHPDLVIRMRDDGFYFESFAIDADNGKVLAAWVDLYRALHYLSRGDGTLSVEEFGETKLSISAPVSTPLGGPHVAQIPDILKLLEGWQKLLAIAGIKSTSPFHIDEVWQARLASFTVDSLLSAEPTGTFEFDSIDEHEPDIPLDAIYFNTASFAGADLSFAVEIQFAPVAAGEKIRRSAGIKPLDVRAAVEDLHAYGAELAEKHKIRCLMYPENTSWI